MDELSSRTSKRPKLYPGTRFYLGLGGGLATQNTQNLSMLTAILIVDDVIMIGQRSTKGQPCRPSSEPEEVPQGHWVQ